MKLVSWNVNGVRAAHKKGLLDYMAQAQADVICLQEAKRTRATPQHIPWPGGYEVTGTPRSRRATGGTIVFTRVKPLKWRSGSGCRRMTGKGG